MKQTISVYEFRQAFHDHGREDSFSYDGLGALFDYFEELEEGGCGEIELDAIAVCCEFSEYDSALDCIESAGYSFTPGDDNPDKAEAEALEWLNDRTAVIQFDGGVVIQSF